MTKVPSKFAESWEVHIDLDGREEIVHWSRRLACSEHELRTAVRAVGSKAADVRRYLGR
jgi:uncharacterized protein DUF3606